MRCLASIALILGVGSAAAQPAEPEHVTAGVDAEDFQFFGDWTFQTGIPGVSGRGFLFAGPAGAALPAATAVA